MAKIPNRKNRTAVGYAQLNVGEIRALSSGETVYDVKDKSSASIPSHAGITIEYEGRPVIGGEHIDGCSSDVSEDYIRMAIRYRLMKLA